MLKKVVISANNNTRAIAFFEEMKSKKEEALKKIDARTKEFKVKFKSKLGGK